MSMGTSKVMYVYFRIGRSIGTGRQVQMWLGIMNRGVS